MFDTQALLTLYLGETGSETVEGYLQDILERRIKGYLNLVNLTELYYILRRRSIETAEEKERNLRSFGVKIIPVTDRSPIWKQAASIKADHSLSLADAFAAATAVRQKATLVTGSDIELERVKNLKLERIAG